MPFSGPSVKMLQKIKNLSGKVTKKKYRQRFQTDKPAFQIEGKDFPQSREVPAGRMNVSLAEKIVNEYGRTLLIINQVNRIRIEEVIKDLKADARPVGERCGGPSDTCGQPGKMVCQKTDQAVLPYPPDTIKEAIWLLLEYEKNDDNIESLKLGLKYLEYFE